MTGCHLAKNAKGIGYLLPAQRRIIRRKWWTRWETRFINQSEVYSGMYGRVNVNFFPYAFGGKKGIGCGLGPVQKLEDGETLSGGHVSAAQAFGAPQAASAAPASGNGGTPPWTQNTGAQINPITGLPM